MKKILLCFVCLICSISPSYAGLILNGDFESGELSPWYNPFSPSWTVTSSESHTGEYSATNVGNYQIRQDFEALLTDDILEISFWMKQPESAISYVSLFYSDATSNGEIVSLSTSDWEFFDITSWLETGKLLTGIGWYGYSGGGAGEDRTYLDDVVTRASVSVPEPSSSILFSLGLLFSLRVVRKKYSKKL